MHTENLAPTTCCKRSESTALEAVHLASIDFDFHLIDSDFDFRALQALQVLTQTHDGRPTREAAEAGKASPHRFVVGVGGHSDVLSVLPEL